MKEADALLALFADMVADRVVEKLREEPLAPPADPSVPPYLDTKEAAKLLGMSNKSLEGLRLRRQGPPYVRIGRLIRYETAAVRAWLAKQDR